MWRVGQVFITEAEPGVWGSMLRWAQESPWTHAFLVTGHDQLVEADISGGVRALSMVERMAHLREQHRSWVVLEAPTLGMQDKRSVAAEALSRVGQGYDYLEALRFLTTGLMKPVVAQRTTCVRFILNAFAIGANYPLFEQPGLAHLPQRKREFLLQGWAVPTELLLYSQLKVHSLHLTPGSGHYPRRRG